MGCCRYISVYDYECTILVKKATSIIKDIMEQKINDLASKVDYNLCNKNLGINKLF